MRLPHLPIKETRGVRGWGYHTLRLGCVWGSNLALQHLANRKTCRMCGWGWASMGIPRAHQRGCHTLRSRRRVWCTGKVTTPCDLGACEVRNLGYHTLRLATRVSRVWSTRRMHFLRMSHAKVPFLKTEVQKSLKTIVFLKVLCKNVANPLCFWSLTSRSA